MAAKKKEKGYEPETGLVYRRSYKVPGQPAAGGWLHSDRAKELDDAEKRNRQAKNAAAGAAGGAAKQSATGGLPVMPGAAITGVEGAPAWWLATAYGGGALTEEQTFANTANAILPTLSPEDQRSLGGYLSTNFADLYGGYANTNFSPIPTELTTERPDYMNPARANAALNVLEKMRTASGGQDLGPGYKYLTDAVSLLTKYSSGGPMTREQYVQFSTALKSLEAGAGKELGAYKNLAALFTSPSFSAGQLNTNAPLARLNI